MPAPARPLDLALVGVGPTASSLLERVSASAGELLGDRPLRIHLVDPHRAGSGRVWRPDQSPLLWMNSMAEDVTMFTDASVTCVGPVRPGPSLVEWARQQDDAELGRLASPALADEIRCLAGDAFPTRLVQTAYLDWFHREVLAALPPNVEVVVHEQRALDVCDAPDGRQLLTLEGQDEPLGTDVVILALGHLDAELDADSQALADFAAAHGLAYVPPGHTAEQDLSVLAPRADVVALGFGQAFTDLVVLLTEGRGGRFVDDGRGGCRYEPSGLEPVLHVGSRRGVPYRSKLGYRLQGPPTPLPQFLDGDGIAALMQRDGPVEFRRDVLPLLAKDIGWGYYHELFSAHRERVTVDWATFAARYRAAEWGAPIDALVVEAVPDPEDRFAIDQLDRPLAGLRFDSVDALHRHVEQHIEADVHRRTDPAYSADMGAFLALLVSIGSVGRIVGSGRLTERSRVLDVNGWWISFFMYYASGPPPARLRQLLALARAGLVRFLGADTTVEADEVSGRFVARSSSHDDLVEAVGLVEAQIAKPSVQRTADPLVRRLVERGEIVEEVVGDEATGWRAGTGKVAVAGPDLRPLDAAGRRHPRRHALGIFTSRPAASALARPGTNAPAFRQNDAVARSVLSTLAALDVGVAGRAERPA